MKKIFGICVVAGVILTGCGAGQTQNAQQNQTKTQQDVQNNDTKVDYTTQLQELEKKITDATTKAESLKASGNLDADYKTGSEMLMELEALSNEADLLEDEIEWEAKNGKMSTYRDDLRQVDRLDKQLDQAEDRVEFEFRLDN